DDGDLGRLRIQKSLQALNRADVAVLVVDGAAGKTPEDEALLAAFGKKNVPHIVVYNKLDLLAEDPAATAGEIWVSALTGQNIGALKEALVRRAARDEPQHRIVGDLISAGDFVVLVTPIDAAAPKGRLILPQQQTIRDILDSDATAIVVKERQLRETLEHLGKRPRLVVTDSQVFAQVSADTPADIALTSFSILFARYKGDLQLAVHGVRAIDGLNDGDAVLIAEGCTHHRQCDDIGTVKIPRWLARHTGKRLNLSFTSGGEFPDDLSPYRLVIHCGGCMLNQREMKYRIQCAQDQRVPITNYGVAIAHMQGILRRSVAPFADISTILEQA
ncbi:MAG: [FeFe] hydrogenase H-cluster maturation GTPase HydF, partial [Eubacteriales bacterium]|nr:[FeFe] hydrogenase H-cluster maturation GTPase HydF [Eubacteriales bacterium]